jgi:hypothetical protein
MEKVLPYLSLGLVLASVIEGINMGILGGNWIGMITTVLFVYSFFILIGYKLRNIKAIFHLLIMGVVGLVFIEWILIGTAPKVGQSIVTSLLFQSGMFFYWATVGFAPRLLLDESEDVQTIRNAFSLFYVYWFGIVYIIGLFLLNGNLRFLFMQTGSALGHIILTWYYISYLRTQYQLPI